MQHTTTESGALPRTDLTDIQEPTLLIEFSFIPHSDDLFHRLAASIAWDDRMKARKTATVGRAYNYSGMTYPDTPMPEDLQTIITKLRDRLPFAPNNCLLNLYETGDSSMGFHADSTVGLAPGTGVAIISLGSERAITFRHQKHRSLWFHYPLPPGSLLYMSDDIQLHWHHAIRPQPDAGPRISLTFRQIADAA